MPLQIHPNPVAPTTLSAVVANHFLRKFFHSTLTAKWGFKLLRIPWKSWSICHLARWNQCQETSCLSKKRVNHHVSVYLVKCMLNYILICLFAKKTCGTKKTPDAWRTNLGYEEGPSLFLNAVNRNLDRRGRDGLWKKQHCWCRYFLSCLGW